MALAGMMGAAKRGANRLSSNWLDAADQSIFFGSRAQRQGLHGGAQDMQQMMKAAKTNRADMRSNIKSERTALEAHRPKAGASEQDLVEFAQREAASSAAIKAERQNYREAMSDIGGGALDAGLDMAKSVGGYYSGADRAGQGWGRGRAVATRAGMTVGAGMGIATGARYATGGSFTENRNGDRDIAGIPFI